VTPGVANTYEAYARALRGLSTIAVVGLSNKPHRTSYGVAEYLQRHGFRIVPVNPNIAETLGEPAYPSVRHVPFDVDIVQVFRRSELVPPVIDDTVAHGARLVWMQSGIRNDAAARAAEAAGIDVVMDACLMVVHRVLSARGLLPENVGAGPISPAG
jgi:predicted CoA-binding protein